MYEVLSGAALDAKLTLTSLSYNSSSTWTGFSRVLSVLDRAYWQPGSGYTNTFPRRPVRLAVSWNQAWVVDILRI